LQNAENIRIEEGGRVHACYHRHEKGGGGEKREGDYSCYTVVVVVQHHIEEVGAVPDISVSK
jgi:hypothetical protein